MKNEILSKGVVISYNSEVAKKIGVFGAILLNVPNFTKKPEITDGILDATGLAEDEAYLGIYQLAKARIINLAEVLENE